jgi:NitT/TauT family transport system ATP-binding protein
LVFQNYRESLLPWRTVGDNLAFGLEMQGIDRQARSERVAAFLRTVSVELPLDRYPYQLSGGQQQLVSIARSLIMAPEILLMDEPFAALDFRARLNMHNRIQDVFASQGQTVLLVSHEVDEAILLSDRVLVLSNRPARVLADIPVPLARPRTREIVLTDEFVRIKRAVFDVFPMNAEG